MSLMNQYLEEHNNAWSPTTLRSEGFRLRVISEATEAANPVQLWDLLEAKGLGKYSRVTYWTRACDYYGWLIKRGHRSGPNVFADWRETNALKFKNAYQRRLPDISYQEARSRIEGLRDGEIKQLCLLLLETGARYFEHDRIDSEGYVIGKGGKRRKLFTDRRMDRSVPYERARRALARVGLKPHSLRKIFASRLRDLNLKEEDLLKVMGWNSMETAKCYLKPKSDEELEKLIQQRD